jgi:hypothetical protein
MHQHPDVVACIGHLRHKLGSLDAVYGAVVWSLVDMLELL